MYAHELGFMSSWRMLTRDKGWIKPILVLTIVGAVPIVGQIVLLGYGLEWARLTAWGVDAAPKQGGVDYGKVFSTGGRAFLLVLSLSFAISLVLQIVLPGSMGFLLGGMTGIGLVFNVLTVSITGAMALFVFVLTLLSGTFINAAALRATLYDSFGAGWNLARLFEMVGRDFGGFCKVLLVSAIGGALQAAYGIVMFALGAFAFGIGALSIAGLSGGYSEEYALRQLFTWGAGPVLLLVLCGIAAMFVGGLLATAMNLVSINAVGQWFRRFEVSRWGVSSAPLPEGVPHKDGFSCGSEPVRPDAVQGDSSGFAPAPGDSQVSAAQDTISPDTSRQAPTAPCEGGDRLPVEGVPAEEAGEPSSARVGEPPAVPVEDVPESLRKPAEPMDAPAGTDEAEGAVDIVERGKKPIPLGPITTHDDDFDENHGPIN